MLSSLVVAYFFFAGAGAGVLFLTSVIDIFEKGHSLSSWVDSVCAANARDPVRRVKAFSLVAGEGLVAFGVMCLVLDLGRIDRLSFLFLSPSISFISLGTFSLVVLLVSGALLCFEAFFEGLPWIRRVLVPLEAVAACSGIFVMTYTGALLFSVGTAIELWNSWWIPVLFLFSSISCGCGVVFVVAVFIGEPSLLRPVVRKMLRVDVAAIVCEMLFAVLFMTDFLGAKDGSWRQLRIFALEDGGVFAAWWIGFILCGIVVPFICEVIASKSSSLRFEGSIVCVFVGIMILLGGWCLRWSMVEAAQWQDIQLAHPDENTRGHDVAFGSDSIGLA